MLNSRDISKLRPDVAANCRKWVERCKAAGLNVLVTSTVRDIEYQEHLYEQGRTRPGKIVTNGRRPTFHWDKAGLAFDFCKNVKGHEYDDPAFFRKAAAIAKEMGFSWGGDWKSFKDTPHIQWDEHKKYTSSMILRGQFPGNMPLFGGEKMTEKRYNTIAEFPGWARQSIKNLCDRGVIRGSGEKDADGYPADLDLTHDMVRLLVFMDRDRGQ